MFGSLRTPVCEENGAYSIQGIPLLSLAERYGTPFYLYDLDWVLARYAELQSVFAWPQTKIHYAMKANANPHLLRALRKAGARLDTISPGEVFYALQLGYKKEDLLYTANNMTNDEILLLKQQGVLFNIDSLSGLTRYASLCPNSEICLRFNSDVVAGEDQKVQTGGDKTKFGIRLELAQQAVDIARAGNLTIVGLHEHTGSGIAEPEKFVQGMKNLLSIARRDLFPDLRFVDFGGGFKVPYRPDEKRIDYQKFGLQVTELFSSFCADYGRPLDLYFEPGKFIASEAGILITRVHSLIQNKARLIAGTDSGFSHLIRPVLYGAYHHILNLSNPKGEERVYDVCGNICETGDLFAEDRALPEIREGDTLAILNAGAYGYTMGSLYNFRPLPNEVVVQNGKDFLSRAALSPQEMATFLAKGFGAAG